MHYCTMRSPEVTFVKSISYKEELKYNFGEAWAEMKTIYIKQSYNQGLKFEREQTLLCKTQLCETSQFLPFN